MSEIFATIDQKQETEAVFSFKWLDRREQYIGGSIEAIDVVQEISVLLKNNDAPFLIVSGASGMGKTRAIYQFAKQQKKNSCFFANWSDESTAHAEIVQTFENLPASRKYIILDDVHLDPRSAVQFCLRLIRPKLKFILLTRHLSDLVQVLREFRVDNYRTFELEPLENISELLSVTDADYLNVEIKAKLLSLANKNPQILALAHEFIEYKLKEDSAFDAEKFLSQLNDVQDLMKAVYRDIHQQFGDPGIELIARAVMLQGIHRSHPFCKKTFRSYVKLRNLRYFYVVNDVIYFRPAMLGEFIAENYYFSKSGVSTAFQELIAASEPAELMSLLSILLLFQKSFPSDRFKSAAALVLASASIRAVSDNDMAKLCLRFYDGFRDAQLIKKAVPNFLDLKLLSSEPALFNQLAIFYAEIGAYKSAAHNWEILLDLAREKNLPGWITVAYTNLGLVYQKLKDWDNALECYNLAYERFMSLNASAGVIQSLINMAQIYLQMDDFEKAIESYKKAARESEKTKDFQRTANLYMSLANLLKKQNQINETIIHLQSARSFFSKAKDHSGSARVCGQLGLIYRSKRDFETAAEYFKKAIEEAEKVDDHKIAAQSYNNLALIHQQKGETEPALEAFQKAANTFRKIDDLKGFYLTQLNLAQLLESKENWNEAVTCYKQALDLQDMIGNEIQSADIHFRLGEIYIKLEDFQQAAFAYEKGLEYGEPEDTQTAAKVFANLALAYQKINLQDRAIQFYEDALQKTRDETTPEFIAKIKSQLAMSFAANQDYAAAISLLMEVLFFYLHQRQESLIREILSAFDQIQNAMSGEEFIKISDSEMNRVVKEGIHWHGKSILASTEAKTIVEQFKRRRKKKKSGAMNNSLKSEN